MRRELLSVLAVVALLCAGLVAVAAASGGGGGVAAAAENASGNESDAAPVNVTAGAQLSTVLSATSAEVQGEVEETAFEIEFERDGDRAEAIADRAAELRDRANEIRETYRDAAEAYREGELTRSEFAQRIAALNARAETVVNASDRVQRRAANVSGLELRAAGFNRTAVTEAVQSLDSVRGAGASALLARFTGQSHGEVEIETQGGLSIAVSSEDGERSRELERDRDENDSITVPQSQALTTARGALSEDPGRWRLARSSVHEYDGYYRFRFSLVAGNFTGEAEVRVDGSTGELFRLEEEIERLGDRGDERDEDEGEERDGRDGDDGRQERGEADELALVVSQGEVAPNATVTLQVLAAGEPTPNATVTLNDRVVGTTDANGTVTLDLPGSGDVEVTATRGGAEGELEVEFETADDRERTGFRQQFDLSATLGDDTVTVRATYNGTGVANATVSADGDVVGTTAADGSVSFPLGDRTEDIEVKLVKGSFEAEYEFAIGNGSLTLVEENLHVEDRPDDEDEGEGTETETDEQNETDDDGETDTETDTPDDDETETDTPDDDETETDTPDEGETETDTPDDEDDDDETDTPDDDDDEDETDTPEDDDG